MTIPPDNPLDDGLLDRYIAGECTPAEMRRAAAWIAAHPAMGDVVAQLRDRERVLQPEDVTHDWQRVRAAMQPEKRVLRPAQMASRRHAFSARVMFAAAAACAVAAIAYLGMPSRETVHRPSQTFATRTGQRAEFALPNGTKVVLAPESKLIMHDDAGALVGTLVGEAFFTVVPNAKHPLIVRTGRVTTRVLGTAFSVRRYATDPMTHVAVVNGKVHVSANTMLHPSITLTAGGVGVVTDTSATTTTGGGVAPYTSWVDGQLAFHETPAVQVLSALTRWYGYQFQLTDSTLARENLTVWISTTSSREALATLKLALDVDLAFKGSVVTVSPRRSALKPARIRGTPDIITPRIREVGR